MGRASCETMTRGARRRGWAGLPVGVVEVEGGFGWVAGAPV
jgi:hypothetical protein